MQLLCQISKKLYGKSIPCQKDIRHIVQSTEVRNNIININLPLIIFIRMHSQESQFDNKCLICSMKFIIYASPAEMSDEKSENYITGRRNMSNEV